ncbi:MAG: substrate-binding domain-containing protein [Pirellulaceae bacterium]
MYSRTWLPVILMLFVIGCFGSEDIEVAFDSGNQNTGSDGEQANKDGNYEGQIVIVSEINGGGDQDIGYKATVDSLKAHPNLRAVFAINDPSALGAWQAINEANKTDVIKIVGFDGEKAGKQAILEGKIYADPIQFPKKMGVEIMKKVLAFQAGEDYEKLELIPTSLYKKADAENDPELQSEAPPEATTAPVEQKGVIGYSAMMLKNPFFVVIRDSLTAAGAQNGYKVITTDAASDVEKQSNQIENFISQGVDAIVLNPTDRLAIGSAIKKANEAGIPVFTCDLQCVAEGIEIAGHIGTDNFQGGELAGKAMIELLGDEGGEVLVLDFKQANSCVLRVNGFKKVINAHNERRKAGE